MDLYCSFKIRGGHFNDIIVLAYLTVVCELYKI
jgi:hypothetical protein